MMTGPFKLFQKDLRKNIVLATSKWPVNTVVTGYRSCNFSHFSTICTAITVVTVPRCRGYSGNQLQVKGQADVKVTHGRQSLTLPLVVVLGRAPQTSTSWLQPAKLDWTEIRLLQYDSLRQLLAHYNSVFKPGVGRV